MELEKDGFIYTVKGRGNFVKKDDELIHRQKEKLLAELEDQARACLKQGIKKQELICRIEKATEEVFV